MGKYNSNKLSQVTKKQYIKNKIWEKELNEYIPWLSVRTVPSHGLVTRIKGLKTNRVHHFLSNLEKGAFYYFEWSDLVIDIREQYPILPIELTEKIAAEMNITHPTNPKTAI